MPDRWMMPSRRIAKDVDGEVTKYVYDGDQCIAEYDANDVLLRKYIHGPSIDEPHSASLRAGSFCMIEAAGGYAGTYYYHFDALGSVVALSDADGDTIQVYEYDVYGQVAASDPNHPNRFLFTGREFDTETGLYYYRARYYNPTIGRFLQTDPMGYGAGMNAYTYCLNDPLNLSDPQGLYPAGDAPPLYGYESKDRAAAAAAAYMSGCYDYMPSLKEEDCREMFCWIIKYKDPGPKGEPKYGFSAPVLGPKGNKETQEAGIDSDTIARANTAAVPDGVNEAVIVGMVHSHIWTNDFAGTDGEKARKYAVKAGPTGETFTSYLLTPDGRLMKHGVGVDWVTIDGVDVALNTALYEKGSVQLFNPDFASGWDDFEKPVAN